MATAEFSAKSILRAATAVKEEIKKQRADIKAALIEKHKTYKFLWTTVERTPAQIIDHLEHGTYLYMRYAMHRWEDLERAAKLAALAEAAMRDRPSAMMMMDEEDINIIRHFI